MESLEKKYDLELATFGMDAKEGTSYDISPEPSIGSE
jgi:hypothetical protein